MSKKEEKKAKVPPGHVPVKILKYVEDYKPGDVVHMDPKKADAFCEPSEVYHGEKLVKHQKGILLSDLENELPPNAADLTAAEMLSLGLKNTVGSDASNDPILKAAQDEAADKGEAKDEDGDKEAFESDEEAEEPKEEKRGLFGKQKNK